MGDAFLPNLAMSLNNLATLLRHLGRWEEALEKAQEAEGIYRQLAQARSDAFFEHWTKSLWTLALCQRALEHHAEACASLHQAVAALAPVFQRWPKPLAPMMAGILREYFQSAEQAKQQPDRELLAPIQETLKKLQAKQPKA